MDVRCPACKVEYEFDDDKVTSAGVTVKCTSCHHVFKVKKDGAAPALDLQETAAAPGDWVIRQADGRTFKFKELTTLQKWIVEQKVTRTDHISRTGQNWKALGEIAELASFFQVVDAARNAAQMAAQGYASGPPQGLLPGSAAPGSAAPGTAAPAAVPPGFPLPPNTAPPGAAPYGSYGQMPAPYGAPGASYPPGVPPQGYPPGSVPPGYITPPAAAQSAVGQATGTFPAGHRPTLETVFYAENANAENANAENANAENQPPNRSPESFADDLDDDDPVAQWKKRGRRRKMALAFLLILGGAGGGLYAAKPELVRSWLAQAGVQIGATGDSAAPALAAAAAALSGSDAELQAAITSLDALLAAENTDALALASRLHTARARAANWLAFVETRGAATTVKAADALLHKAYELAGKAMAGGTSARAHLAGADYQAARGGIAEMEADLNVAAAETELSAEVAMVRVLGRSHRVLAGGSASALEQLNAARLDPAVRADDRRTLTIALLVKAARGASAKDLTADFKALQIVEGVGGIATKLEAALQKGPFEIAKIAQKGARDSQAQADLSTPGGKTSPGKNTGTDASGNATGSPAKATPSKATPGKTGGSLNVNATLKKAKKALMAGRTQSALGLYRKVLKSRPGSASAHAGIGWAKLDAGNNRAAINAFKKAVSYNGRLADAQLGLGEAFRAEGNKASAIKAFKRYLTLAPGGADASIAKRAIKGLE